MTVYSKGETEGFSIKLVNDLMNICWVEKNKILEMSMYDHHDTCIMTSIVNRINYYSDTKRTFDNDVFYIENGIYLLQITTYIEKKICDVVVYKKINEYLQITEDNIFNNLNHYYQYLLHPNIIILRLSKNNQFN